MRHDEFGRVHVTVPDDWARFLRAWRLRTWREIHGYAYGDTPSVQDGPIAEALAAIRTAAHQAGDPLALVVGQSFPLRPADPDYGLMVSSCGVARGAGGYYLQG